MPKLKCFIASALGKHDVDVIYNDCVKKVLKEFKIKANRIDEEEHNEDIDDKIFELINDSDFCIADLTYARPSVYYEAGYVFGSGKPVVYIARNDHFRNSDDSQRVHFDLQMKNIIPWGSSNAAFKEKLKRRLEKVLRPFFNEQMANSKRKEEEKQFSLLSPKMKKKEIRKRAKVLLNGSGFKVKREKNTLSQKRNFPVYRKSDDRLEAIYFSCDISWKKNELKGFSFFYSFADSYSEELQVIHNFFISVRPFQVSRFTDNEPSFKPLGNKSFFHPFPNRNGEISHEVYVHFIDDIKSISDFSAKYKAILERHSLIKPSKKRQA